MKLALSIQEKLSTSDGPAGIGTLSIMAELFTKPEDQLIALERISGFNQKVQVQILKKSKGNIENLASDRKLALDGEFDINMCKGISECVFISDEHLEQIGKLLGVTISTSIENKEGKLG